MIRKKRYVNRFGAYKTENLKLPAEEGKKSFHNLRLQIFSSFSKFSHLISSHKTKTWFKHKEYKDYNITMTAEVTKGDVSSTVLFLHNYIFSL